MALWPSNVCSNREYIAGVMHEAYYHFREANTENVPLGPPVGYRTCKAIR